MRARHVHVVLIMSLASLSMCEHDGVDVLDKLKRQEGRANPKDGGYTVQGTLSAAEPWISSPEPRMGPHISPVSVDGLKWSSNNSRSLYNGLLTAFGLQPSKKTLRFLEAPQEDSSLRRRSTKEVTTPHIIHQVTGVSLHPCSRKGCPPSCSQMRKLQAHLSLAYQPLVCLAHSALPRSIA